MVERQFTLVGVAEKLLRLGGRFPLVFNSYFLNALRCLAMLEGVAINSDANFSVLNVLYPTVMRKILEGEAQGTFKMGLEKVLRAEDGRFQWDKLDRMLNEARKAEETCGSKLVLLSTSGSTWSKRNRKNNTPLSDVLLSNRGKFLRAELMREWNQVGESAIRKSGFFGKLKAFFLFLPAIIMRMLLFMFMMVVRTLRKVLRLQPQQP